MQSAQKLISVFRELLLLVDEETTRNPEFAARLETIMTELPARAPRPLSSTRAIVVVPDVFAALEEKGDSEFRFWVRTLDVPTLRAVIKRNGFDPAKSSQRWTDPDKLAALIVEQTVARTKRGAAFLPPKADKQHPA